MKKTWIVAALLASGGFVGSASASSMLDASANAGSITILPNGSIVVVAPSGNYEGDEDVGYNVFNTTTATLIPGFTVTGAGIAGFDGDGIDNYFDSSGTRTHATDGGGGGNGTNTTPQGYAGYTDNLANTYSGFVIGGSTVNVSFGNGGLAAGHSAFISFEQPGGVNGTIITVTPTTPLPPAVWSGLALVLGIAAYSRFSKTKIA